MKRPLSGPFLYLICRKYRLRILGDSSNSEAANAGPSGLVDGNNVAHLIVDTRGDDGNSGNVAKAVGVDGGIGGRAGATSKIDCKSSLKSGERSRRCKRIPRSDTSSQLIASVFVQFDDVSPITR